MSLSASRVAARHLASTGAECEFFKATDGKWYMGLEDMSARPDSDDGDEEDDDWSDSYDPEMEYYGPFSSFEAAEKYLERNFANPGGYTEDDSGRQRPPVRPTRPRMASDTQAATHTSPMEAITNPARWGYKVVDVFYGEARPRRDQSMAMKGDVLQDAEGNLWEFKSRQNNRLNLTPV